MTLMKICQFVVYLLQCWQWRCQVHDGRLELFKQLVHATWCWLYWWHAYLPSCLAAVYVFCRYSVM